ncbi:unnamed protein product [Sphagnum jensenii]|uniref:DUF4423 domain-containing protein n=1 Tax=Sphagnum jensenii TaxID=128206 RepID=A0ABP0V5K0_9BRYO
MLLGRDHAAELARFWNLERDECEYFIGLVDLSRASSRHLRGLIKDQLQRLKNQRKVVSQKILGAEQVTDLKSEATYYSTWYWSAIHLLVEIPEFQTQNAIARRLSLPIEIVQNALIQLETMGLVKRSEDRWIPGKKNIHLPEDSVMREMNHMHWRLRALQDVQSKNPASFHYTSVFSVSRGDLEKLHSMMTEFMMQSRKLIVPSPAEELCCLSCDFFSV